MTTLTSQPFRPMTLGELLDRAIGLYRQNFFKFIGIVAIPFIPLQLLQIGMSVFASQSVSSIGDTSPGNPFNAGFFLAYAGIFIIAIFQFFLVQGVATAALTRSISDNYTGQKTGILDAYDRIGSSWVNLIVALLFIMITIFIAYIWMIIPCVGWFTGPGLLIFLYYAVVPLIAPSIVLEKSGILISVRHAWDLARSRFWWLMGCVLVLALFGQLIVWGPVLLLSMVLGGALSLYPVLAEQQALISTIFQSLITMFTGLLYLPIQITVMTLVYFDLRARSEGLDLALQLPSEPVSETDVVRLPEIQSQTQAPLLTWMDMGRFALISLGIIALYVILVSVIIGFAGMLGSALPR